MSRLLRTLVLLTMAAVPANADMPGKLIAGDHPKPSYAPNQVIVCFSDNPNVTRDAKGAIATRFASVDAVGRTLRLKRMNRVFADAVLPKGKATRLARRIANAYKIEFDSGADPLVVAKTYAEIPGVEYAEPVYTYHIMRTDPNDTFWSTSNSWGQGYRDQWDMERMACPAAWDIQTGNQSVVVAVIDTGIDHGHSDLQANMWHNPGEIPGNGVDDDANGKIDDYHGYDFANSDSDPMDDHGHGTHVAGTIGAVGNNGAGICGINWACSLMAIKGLTAGGNGDDAALASAIQYAADEGANVINMSWGGTGLSYLLDDALTYAHTRGVVLCAAAGNDNLSIVDYQPASDNRVITIAASDQNDAKCYFSNWGVKIAVTAPGGNGSGSLPVCATFNILSARAGATDPTSGQCGAGACVVGGSYYRLAGTSMACPHVAGLAALILAQHPGWTNEQVRQAIQMRADNVQAAGFDRYSGFGRINAYNSLTSPEPMTAFISNPNNGVTTWGNVSVDGTADGPSFSSWTLDFGASPEPTFWTTVASSTTPVTAGHLADWNISSLPSGTYTLRLRTTGSGSVLNAEYRLRFDTAGPPPTNDECSTPTVISSLPFHNTMSTTSALESPSDPVLECRGRAGYNTVWYSFTPSEAMSVTADTTGSNYDTVLAAWQGSCGALTAVACNDDSGDVVTSQISFTATAGTTYYLEVAAYADTGGNCTLNVMGFSGGLVDHFTQMFDTGGLDLSYKSVTFTPDGSADFYAACTRPISSLPTDPTGGTPIAVTDDSFELLTLSGGQQVSLYGVTHGALFVGSNGYITFGSGDSDYSPTLLDHFRLPRISALFHDLVPSGSGPVSWKQLSDRVAVTFLSVPDYGGIGSNTFQMELFFDGRIVISYLNMAASDGITGLSDGTGIPASFVQSDLSGYPACSRAVDITWPNGGELIRPGDPALIQWSVNSNWDAGDTVRVESSKDSGAAWTVIPGAGSLPFGSSQFAWDTAGLTQTDHYRVRVTCNQDALATDSSDADFSVRVEAMSVTQCKLLPEGAPIACASKVVSAVFGGVLYVQEPDRFAGIGILWGGSMPAVGDRVDVVGTMTSADYERLVDASGVDFATVGAAPKPMVVMMRAIGGGDLSYDPGPPATGQRGVDGRFGLNNTGLLIRTWGKVVDIDPAAPPTWFVVADKLPRQVLVVLPPGVGAPMLNQLVGVTGISSIRFDGVSSITAQIKPRNSGDIQVFFTP